jgi:hypothetical protein
VPCSRLWVFIADIVESSLGAADISRVPELHRKVCTWPIGKPVDG